MVGRGWESTDMKITVWLAALMAVCGMAAASEFVVDRAESTFLEKRYESSITFTNLKGAPAWDAEKSPPPLTPRKAANLAESAAQLQLGNHPLWPADQPGWSAVKIALTKFHNVGWYYRIELQPKFAGSGSLPDVIFFVTMNGKALPLVEKQKAP